MIKLLDFVFSAAGRWVLGGGVVALLLVGFVNQQRNIGATAATARIERATAHVSKTLSTAADRARDPSVRGKRDPSTRDD